jgi:photoactive yellow protein
MADQSEKQYPFLDSDDTDAVSSGDSEEHRNGQSSSDEAADVDGDVSDLTYDDPELGEKLRHASEETLNSTDFGIIQVDEEGVVQFFNRYESELSGVAREEAEGRNFFKDVAPCTNNRLFFGRFKKGMRRGDLDEEFTYTYTYKMKPTLVNVHLYRDSAKNNWILVQKC